ncbi:MAG: ABC transporter substrate-binding protein [Deltaproteobacteria bacterium]|nr:MAG: ABC transporter substrate-binding protein [Deltaproteobacteria bacterium]
MKRTSKILAIVLLVCVLAVGVAKGAVAQEEVVLTYVTQQETMCFDPAKSVDETELGNIFNTYDMLVYPLETGKALAPWLAESWDASEDGLTYTFHLRKGVLFHDGTELTAEDVAFSMDRMLRINMGFSWLWKGILDPGDVKVIDKYTVAFHLNKTFGPFIATLVEFGIVNKDLIMANMKAGEFGEFGDYGQEYLEMHDAGSGPYIPESIELGNRVMFRKFDGYWRGWEKGQIDKVRWLVIPESATMVVMMKKGEADMSEQWLSPEAFEDMAATPGVVVEENPQMQLFFLQMNNKKPPFDDVNVRRAISYAFDYETAIEAIFKGGVQARGSVPVLMPGHSPKVHVYYQDLDLAKRYLENSKYSMKELEGMSLTFVYVKGLEIERKVGLLLANNLKKLGFDVKIRSEVWGTITDMATKPEATPHFTAIYHTAKYPSPDSHTYLIFNPKAWGNYISMSWYENPVVTYLADKARTTVDTEERYRLYGEVQRIGAEEAAALFVANPVLRRAFRDHVKGYRYPGILGYDLVFYNLRIEK